MCPNLLLTYYCGSLRVLHVCRSMVTSGNCCCTRSNVREKILPGAEPVGAGPGVGVGAGAGVVNLNGTGVGVDPCPKNLRSNNI